MLRVWAHDETITKCKIKRKTVWRVLSDFQKRNFELYCTVSLIESELGSTSNKLAYSYVQFWSLSTRLNIALYSEHVLL